MGAGVPTAVPVAQPADPRAALDAMPAVFIKQDVSLMEVLSGCEMKNKYNVYIADPATMDKVPGRDAVFKMKEHSTCFQRQCCGPHREFTMPMFLRDLYNPTEGQGPQISDVFRPFKCCEFLCFNRPELFVQDASGQQIGHVYNPFTCCSFELDVGPASDKRPDKGAIAADAPKAGAGWPWKLFATCNQLGVYCSCPCEPCKRVIFEIRDQSGTPVGEFHHVFPGCCKDVIEVDNYYIRFPAGATWQQKVTLIYACILADFLWWEKKNNNNNNSM